MIEIIVERVEQFGLRHERSRAFGKAAFHQVRELSEAHRAGHAGTAFERVQRPPQALDRLGVHGLAPPRAQLLARLGEQLGGFLEEDRKHLAIDIIVHAGDRGIDCGRGCRSGGECSGGPWRNRSRGDLRLRR